jgi:uncharacterized protein YlxP (DUF503 family)
MRVALLTVDLQIPESQSLKDKRQVVRSLLARIRDKFNVSAAEIDHLDLWQRASFAIAAVGTDAAFLDQVLSAVEDLIQSDPRCVLLDAVREDL